ncbi:hypothetical protein [Geminocystis herdmanii]|uniref:hypothetical protein n=1 Tax=Geminocystis herdmanii TaxID=669359 RepID=UPI00034C40F7|nr:hypothetical protein [Geminocystis herdmanii]
MADLYLFLFITICIAIVGWSIIRLERIYQFPFFMASVFLSFILPQAIAIVDNPGIAVTNTALERMLIYSCLCVAMCWLGYQFSPNENRLNSLNIEIDEHKLFKAGLVLLTIGLGCSFALSRIEIQIAANNQWTGIATILSFFQGTLNIALPLFLLRALKNPSVLNIALTAITAFPTLQAIILAGRRQPTVAFLITIGLCIFIGKRYIPPRFALVVLIPIATYVIPLLGRLRGKFWELVFTANWEAIQSNSQEGLEAVIEGEILELRNATLVMDYAVQLDQYGYGRELWNNFIFGYVPGQLVGWQFKESLQFNNNYDLAGFYGYQPHSGTTLTGMGDSFMDFGFFGCLFFALMAYVYKTLWVSTIKGKSMISTLLYISLIDSAMVSVTHGIGRFLNEFIFKVGILFLIAYYGKASKSKETKLYPIP